MYVHVPGAKLLEGFRGFQELIVPIVWLKRTLYPAYYRTWQSSGFLPIQFGSSDTSTG